MSRLAILAGLMAIAVNVQAEQPQAPGFRYVGCVFANESSFPTLVDFIAPYPANECAEFCGGIKADMSAIGGGCRCSDPNLNGTIHFTIVGDEYCPISCIFGDESAGKCGGIVSQDGHEYFFDLYQRDGIPI